MEYECKTLRWGQCWKKNKEDITPLLYSFVEKEEEEWVTTSQWGRNELDVTKQRASIRDYKS